MGYFHTYPNARLRFFAGNMQLHIDSDAAYLVMPGAKSCFVGYFYMASNPHTLNYNGVLHNAPILVECHALKNRTEHGVDSNNSGSAGAPTEGYKN
eukprot:4115155-Ditylum_brightwellii.AAC.1